MIDELIAFFTARLDEEESEVKAVYGFWHADDQGNIIDTSYAAYVAIGPNGKGIDEKSRTHILRYAPVRTLREIGADRAILSWYADSVDASSMFRKQLGTGTHMAVAAESYLNVIKARAAAAWGDHPAYRKEWAPCPS